MSHPDPRHDPENVYPSDDYSSGGMSYAKARALSKEKKAKKESDPNYIRMRKIAAKNVPGGFADRDLKKSIAKKMKNEKRKKLILEKWGNRSGDRGRTGGF